AGIEAPRCGFLHHRERYGPHPRRHRGRRRRIYHEDVRPGRHRGEADAGRHDLISGRSRSVPNAAMASAATPGPVRVLLVEDSGVSRALMTQWLNNDPDIRVVADAGNGAAAIRVAATANPDVIVLDVQMPGMDGIAALPRL